MTTIAGSHMHTRAHVEMLGRYTHIHIHICTLTMRMDAHTHMNIMGTRQQARMHSPTAVCTSHFCLCLPLALSEVHPGMGRLCMHLSRFTYILSHVMFTRKRAAVAGQGGNAMHVHVVGLFLMYALVFIDVQDSDFPRLLANWHPRPRVDCQ